MIAAPPSEAGAVHDRLTWALPAVAVSPVGGPGLSTLACSPAAEVRTQAGHRGARPPDGFDRGGGLAVGTGAQVDVVADDRRSAIGGGRGPRQAHLRSEERR